MRQWAVRPRLEALELRTLPSTAGITLPASPGYGAPIAAWTATPSVATGAAPTDSADPIAADRSGFDRLLQDVAQFVPVAPAGTTAVAPTGVAASTPLAAVDPADVASTPLPLVASAAAISTPIVAVGPVAVAATPQASSFATDVSANSEVKTTDLGPATALVALPTPSAPVAASPPPVSLPTAVPNVRIVPAQSTENVAGTWSSHDTLAARDGSSAPTVADLPTVLATPLAVEPAPRVMQHLEEPSDTAWVPSAAPAACHPEPTAPFALDSDANPLPPGDGALLEQFVTARDQEAFATLVARYEPMVLSICQRALGDAQAAEDACQATFLVLARKAGALDPRRPLAGWLYVVAYHLALRLRAVTARRRRSEHHAAYNRSAHDDSAALADLETQEIYQVLREELQRLPDKYRVPLVLCYFEGQTHADAARTIGMPRGSVAKRIGEGLHELRRRMGARGIHV